MKQLGRFFIVGGIATLVDYCIFSVAVFFSVHYSLGVTMGYLVGFGVHFTLSKKHVFCSGVKIQQPFVELLVVFGIAVIGLLLNIVIVWFLSDFTQRLNLFTARLVAIILVFFWSYFARKIVVYH